MAANYERITKFLNDNDLSPEKWREILLAIPSEKLQKNEFYLDCSRMDTDLFVKENNRNDLIQWMKLTEKLFL